MNRSLTAASMVALFGCFCSEAAALTLGIDPTRSSIEITTTTADDGFGPYVGQASAPGGFATTLSGVVEIDVTGSTLQLLSGSTLIADDEELFDPGAASASFASTYPGVTILGGQDFSTATRGLGFTIEDAAPRALIATVVEVGAPAVGLTQGVADLSAGNPPQVPLGFLGLTGSGVTTGPGTYEVVGQEATLTLPFEFTIEIAGLISTSTTYAGEIVATGVIPEPTSAALVASVVGLVAASRSGKR